MAVVNKEKLARQKAEAKASAARAREKTAAAKVRAKEAAKAKSAQHANGFMVFIREQGVVGLAVGIAIGGAVAVLARSLIDNIILPPVGLLFGSPEGLKGLSLTIGKASGREATLDYGVFLNDLVNFIIIAIVIYLVVHVLGFDRIDKKKE